MVSTRMKRQSNRKLLSRLDDFDQDTIFGNAASEIQGNIVVIEGNIDLDFTVGNSSNNIPDWTHFNTTQPTITPTSEPVNKKITGQQFTNG